MRTLLLALLLIAPAQADPTYFLPDGSPQGRVVLVAEDGTEEARALARCGLACALTHADNEKALAADLNQTRVKLQGPLSLLGLSQRASLVRGSGSLSTAGRICLFDPQPDDATGLTISTGIFGRKAAAPGDKAQVTYLIAPMEAQKAGTSTPVTGTLSEDNSAAQKELRRLIAIQQPLPLLGLPNTKYIQSPNWGVRSLGDRIDTVVVHSTVIDTLEGTERAFLDDKVRRVSAHYVVDRDGTIVQMVDERRAAWHAGVSELNGRTGVNDFSVGVELVNLNDGKDPYPEAQLQSLIRIIQDLRTRHDIPDERIVSHEFVARPVGRKNDPMGFDFVSLKQRLKLQPTTTP